MSQREQHLLAGRLVWAGGCVSYCTCGRAYFGFDREAADDRYHRHVRAEDPGQVDLGPVR